MHLRWFIAQCTKDVGDPPGQYKRDNRTRTRRPVSTMNSVTVVRSLADTKRVQRETMAIT